MSPIDQSASEFDDEDIEIFKFDFEFRSALAELWKADCEESPEEAQDPSSYSVDSCDIQFSLAEPEPLSWAIVFTPAVRKAVSVVDKSMQGRVLAAITELSDMPTTVRETRASRWLVR